MPSSRKRSTSASYSNYAASIATESSVIEHYHDFDDYDSTVLNDYKYSAHERVPGAVLRLLSPEGARKLHVLDLGCGTGLSSEAFLRQCHHHVTGVDVSPQMLEQAESRGLDELLLSGVDEAVALLHKTQRRFDAIVILGVMEFVREPAALLRQIAPLLRPDGRLGLAVPDKQPEATERQWEILTHELEPMREALTAAGLTLEWSESFLGYDLGSSKVGYQGMVWKAAAAGGESAAGAATAFTPT